MQKKRLGNSEMELTPIGVGAWAMGGGGWAFAWGPQDDDESISAIHAALDHGVNWIDTAAVYGLGHSEEVVARALHGRSNRPYVFTKCARTWNEKREIQKVLKRDSVRQECEDSLRRLQVDVIDLYQVHRPDMFTHPAEVAATMAALREEGKIREVGVSNHTPAQVAALQAHLPFPLASNQPEYSAAHLDPLRDGTLDACMRDGITPLAWSPLAGGRLATGDGVRPELLSALDEIAAREGVERSHVALAFVLAHPSAPVAIIGSQNPARIVASTRALGVRLDRADVYRIVQASEGVPLP
jgi:aryl-alcohol dehydrogenase-like predicted oxidoreductase